jgi:hypothetical protein
MKTFIFLCLLVIVLSISKIRQNTSGPFKSVLQNKFHEYSKNFVSRDLMDKILPEVDTFQRGTEIHS